MHIYIYIYIYIITIYYSYYNKPKHPHLGYKALNYK